MASEKQWPVWIEKNEIDGLNRMKTKKKPFHKMALFGFKSWIWFFKLKLEKTRNWEFLEKKIEQD